MASQAFTSAGTRIYIGDAVPNEASYNVTGFESVNWTEIGEVSDLGEFGREYSEVTFNPLGDRRTVKRKGSYNDGNVTMTMARVPYEDGQEDLIAARDSDSSVPIKVVLQDLTVIYFAAQVMSYTVNVGSVDQITTASVTLGITDDILEDLSASS